VGNENVCEACKGRGWILASTGECYEEIQRCDACDKYPGDVEAWTDLRAAMERSKLRSLGYERGVREHFDGVLEMLDQFKPRILQQADWEAERGKENGGDTGTTDS
jgi:hypothetical protein